ncbi:MAG: PASTA domain-containing protein [Pseudomonadota bacterium]
MFAVTTRIRLVWLALLLVAAGCSPTDSNDTVIVNPDVVVPETAGSSVADAQQAIRDAGLRVGATNDQSSDTIPIGSVIGTSPGAGSSVAPDSLVNIAVSTGSADVDVPVTAGSTQAEAETLIVAAGLVVGDVASEASDTVPVGQVIRTVPGAGETVPRSSNVQIVISTGPANVSVPAVTNLTEAAATTDIEGATLLVGTITGAADDMVPVGNVISQDPVAGTMVSANTLVNLVISLGPANVATPETVGLTEADAITALTNAGLTLGDTSAVPSVDVVAGSVVSQDPAAGTLVAATTAVNLVISLGPDPVPVPDIVGLQEAQAMTVLFNAGLEVGVVIETFSNTVPLGEIISQSLPPGQIVPLDTALDYTVSLGPPVSTPNVVGLSQPAAEAALVAAELVVGDITEQNDFNVPEGDVISQDPTAGTNVATGTPVDLVVSLGPPTVAAPSVVGQSLAAAGTTLDAAGLVTGTVSQQPSLTVPAGDVISQTPIAGTIVIVGTDVDLVVSNGPPPMVVVPDVSGQAQAQAEAAIVAANLVVGTITDQNDATIPAGSIVSQNPAGGVSVVEGSAVDLVRSIGPLTDTFSDEFAVNTIADWQLRHVVEGAAAQYTVLDINASTAGALTLVPTQTPGWFNAGDGPLVFKELAGNFAVHTRVTADSVMAPGQAPTSDFNSAGLMARNASGASGPENYVMLNVGRQDASIAGGVGSETKNTVDSVSALFLDTGSNEGSLILCRVGNVIHSFRWLTTDSDWVLLRSETRADLPSTLQVGMVANAFAAPADLRAEFEFIRLLPAPNDVSACTAGVTGG